jgi:hypothetical protein
MSHVASLLAADLRSYGRQHFLLTLLIVVPLLFVTLMYAVTPDGIVPVPVVEGGRSQLRVIDMATLHGAIMVPITVGFLSGLVGLYLMLNSKDADARLLASGVTGLELLAARATLLLVAVIVITALSTAAALPGNTPDHAAGFIVANVLTGLEYGLFGVVLGALVDRLGGTYVMFFGPMIDIGLIQNPMLPRVNLDWWMRFTPGFQVTEIAVDTAFTPDIDTQGDFLGAGVWIALLAVLAARVLVRGAPRSGQRSH